MKYIASSIFGFITSADVTTVVWLSWDYDFFFKTNFRWSCWWSSSSAWMILIALCVTGIAHGEGRMRSSREMGTPKLQISVVGCIGLDWHFFAQGKSFSFFPEFVQFCSLSAGGIPMGCWHCIIHIDQLLSLLVTHTEYNWVAMNGRNLGDGRNLVWILRRFRYGIPVGCVCVVMEFQL